MTAHSGVFIDDGLGPAARLRYKRRRKALAKAVGCPILIVGVKQDAGYENRAWHMSRPPIYQDPILLYLTGINQHHVALLIDSSQGDYHETLFLPEKDPNAEFWDGYRLGVGDPNSQEEAAWVTGIKDIRPTASLHEDLVHYLRHTKAKQLGMPWYEDKKGKVFKDRFAEEKKRIKHLLTKHKLKIDLRSIIPEELALRLPLDSTDQANLSEAIRKTTKAFKATVSQLHTFRSESDAAGTLDGEIAKLSPFRNSFPSIVASGQNAAVLHYAKNNDPFPKQGLLLMDFGVKHYAMHADITRTVPLNGHFNPLQACIYQIVLDTQVYVESQVKPGRTIAELNTMTWTYMEDLIETRFTSKGGIATRPYDTQPHNVGHFLGHMVHDGDPTRVYREWPLRVGQVITNEPGLYGHFELMVNGKHYAEHIGVRIEDNLLITKTGCQNLSVACPKRIDAIEKLAR